MWRPWHERRGLIPWLLLFLGVLLVANLWKEGLLNVSVLRTRKEEIETISSVIGGAAILIGGALAYVRFFKGRVLRPKLIVTPRAGSIPGRAQVLYWLDVEIENKGSVAVWDYKIEVRAKLHGSNQKVLSVSDFMKLLPEKAGERLIDVGESAFEHAVFPVLDELDAITFQIRVTDQTGSSWDRFLTLTAGRSTGATAA